MRAVPGRPLKVCIVTTAFPRWEGDAQGSFIWEAVRSVARAGAQVRVIAMHAPGAATCETIQGIEVIRPRYLPKESWEILRREGGGLPIMWRRKKWARLLFLPFAAVHTLAVVRHARDCDLVHANWTLSAAAANLGRLIHRRPVVATLQGSDIFQVPRSKPGKWFTQRALAPCDRVIVLSQALKQATAALGVPPARLTVVPNGVNTAEFSPGRPEEREDLILFVGSLIPRKAANVLLDALPGVLGKHPSYRLVLLGDGPDEQSLRIQATGLGLDDKVTFLGFRPQAEVRALMRRARVFVLPSLEEGLGVVLLEALACGTPIVASGVDGIVDVVIPDVGVLVPPADPRALARGILQVLANETSWEAMSAAARARAESVYDWDIIAGQLMSVYRSASG